MYRDKEKNIISSAKKIKLDISTAIDKQAKISQGKELHVFSPDLNSENLCWILKVWVHMKGRYARWRSETYEEYYCKWDKQKTVYILISSHSIIMYLTVEILQGIYLMQTDMITKFPL